MSTQRSFVWILWTMLLSPAAGVAQEAAGFQFSRPILVESRDQEELFSVPFDSDVYASTRDGFPDLRVLDAENRIVPFLIRRIAETRIEKVRKFWKAHNPTLKPLDSNGLEIRIVLHPEDPSPAGLNFVTPLNNFEQQVQVFATTDGAESPLIEAALIFDYSQFMDVRRTAVALPSTTAREFRIVIDAVTSDQESQLLELTRSLRGENEDSRTEKTTIQRRPFRIDQIEFWTEQVIQAQPSNLVRSWPVTDLKVSEDEEQKQTLIEFSSRREPVTELSVLTSSRNFSRHAAVQVPVGSSGRSENWSTIADATISQFQLRNVQEQHVKISLPETRQNRMRIVLDNRDSRTLSIEDVVAVGHQYEAVFLGKPEQKFRLIYGSETAEPLQQDLAALTMALAKDIRPVSATLGVQSARSDAEIQQPMTIRDLLNNRLALGAVIGVLVLVLGWGLYQAARRIDQTPHQDHE